MKKKNWLFAWIWVGIALATLIAATYAWFTFNPFTNVEPMSSTISQGDASLLIANNPNATFSESCTLTPESNPEVLQPISSADLSTFYTATAQSPQGISILYKEVTAQLGENAIHGTVYLQSVGGSCDVYLYRSGINFGSDTQALASLRLGLKVTTQKEENTYLFKLDDMGNVGGASSTRTVPTSGTVVSSISNQGVATYVTDPSVGLSDYFAKENGSNDAKPTAGNTIFATLQTDEIASVEYWLYLEGCDDNCLNEVQNRNLSLQLAFAGVTREDTQ
jgi:hypothetical protein